jgi:hypothetical protein
MRNPHRRALTSVFVPWILCLALGAAPVATPVLAQAPVRPAGSSSPRAGAVSGTAWHADNSPVSRALVRLRNITSGQVVLGAQADAAGRFAFEPVPPGSYLVELVDEAGSVRAVGQTFSVGAGETIATFVRLAARDRWFDGFFGNAAAAALSAAASLGLTAVGDGVQPASPRF